MVAGPTAGPAAFAYRASVRPDGHGIWVEQHARVPFFLEYDTGTEPLSTLVDKLDRYASLAERLGRTWPVLFCLHSAARERNLHRRLAELRLTVPVATTARDDDVLGDRSPAGEVWWLHRYDGGPLRLAELAATVVDRRREAA